MYASLDKYFKAFGYGTFWSLLIGKVLIFFVKVNCVPQDVVSLGMITIIASGMKDVNVYVHDTLHWPGGKKYALGATL